MFTNLNKKTLLSLNLFVFLSLFTNAQLLTQPDIYTRYDSLFGHLNPLRTCYDAIHYDIAMDIDLDTKSIKATSTMDFIWVEHSDMLQLDLFSRYKVISIKLNNIPVEYFKDSNHLLIPIFQKLKVGKKYHITTQYEGIPIQAKKAPWDGGFVWKEDSEKNHWVGVACEGLGASSWWPCKDHWSDEPELGVCMNFTVPKGYTAVSNGKLIKHRTEKKKEIWQWNVSEPINLYSISLNIAKYKHFGETYISKVDGDTLSINYWVLPENFEKAKEQFKEVNMMLDCFEGKFGKYPFYQDGYQLIETPYLGMEHQSCIAYGNKYQNGYLGNKRMTGGYDFDYIIIHESGHEWFGNNITAADNADMWIHEAYTTYSESMFVDCLHGSDAGIDYVASMDKRVQNDRPIRGDYSVAKEGSGDMYTKGALFLNTLRSQVNNDTKWYAYLKEINRFFYHKTTSYDEVLAFTNTFFNAKLDALFTQYVLTTDVPILKLIENDTLLYVHYENIVKELKIKTFFTIAGKEISYDIGAIPIEIKVNKSKDWKVETRKTYIKVEK